MTTPADAAPAPWRRNAVLAASLLFMTIGTGSVYFVVVALKPIAAEFGWPRAVPSLAYSLQYFGGGVGGIFMGWVLDRRGMGPPAFIGATMVGGGALLASMLTNEWQLYFIYGLMMGLFGRSTLFSPLMANIIRWFDDNKSRAVGMVGAGQALAGVVWPPIFQTAFDRMGWRETSFWYGIFALAALLPLAFILRWRPPVVHHVPSAAGGTGDRPAATPTHHAPAPLTMQVTLCFAAIGCCVAMSLPLAHLVSHVSDLGYSAARGAEILALMLGTAAASSFFGVGYLGKRFGGLKAIFIFSSAQMVFLAILAFVDSLAGLYAVGILFGLGYGGILPCYPIIVREYLPPAQVGRRTATVILFASFGMAVGSWLGGAVFDRTGAYELAFLIGAGFNLGNLALIGGLIWATRPIPATA